MAFEVPSLQELKALSEKYRFRSTEDELQAYQRYLGQRVGAYTRVQEMVEAIPPVKYPRTPGYRPDESENPYNAWYWKCSIKGATSGKLQGLKVGIKDNILVAGVPCMNGSRVLEGYIPDCDATVVTRLLDAGAEIIGKTTCEDLCFSGASYLTTYGPVRNPVCPAYSAGGSSSGSAVVVATGEADLAVGGDQGGSVRNPASSCGIVGLKPTYGLVPYTNAFPIEMTLDHLGPMTRTVRDCALMLEVLAGYDDGADPRQPSTGFNVPRYTEEILKSTKSIKVGVLDEGFRHCDEDIVRVVNEVVDKLAASDRFAVVNRVTLPMHLDAKYIAPPIAIQGSGNQMIDGTGYGVGIGGLLSSGIPERLRQGFQENGHTLSHSNKIVVMLADYMKHKYGVSTYSKARALVLELRRRYNETLKSYDVLLMPTLTRFPCSLPTESTPVYTLLENSLNMVQNTSPFNLTHHPALTVNAGYCDRLTDNGAVRFPVGIQIVGRHWEDATVLQVGKTIEDLVKGVWQ